jgi:hypothetical protein
MQRAGSKRLDNGVVLLVETPLQGFFAFRVQRQQIEVIIGASVQYAAAEINNGIDERVRGAAVFRLDVIRGAACFDVRIVTENHSAVCLDLRLAWERHAGFFPPHLTDWRLNRIIAIRL